MSQMTLKFFLSHFDLKSWVTWVETKTFKLVIYSIGYPTGNGAAYSCNSETSNFEILLYEQMAVSSRSIIHKVVHLNMRNLFEAIILIIRWVLTIFQIIFPNCQ